MDYKKMWETLRMSLTNNLREGQDDFCCGIIRMVMNTMDLIENGFYICPKCGKKETGKTVNYYCQDCIEQLEKKQKKEK